MREHSYFSAIELHIMDIPLGMFKFIDQLIVRGIHRRDINRDGDAQTNDENSGCNEVKACLEVSSFPYHGVAVPLCHRL